MPSCDAHVTAWGHSVSIMSLQSQTKAKGRSIVFRVFCALLLTCMAFGCGGLSCADVDSPLLLRLEATFDPDQIVLRPGEELAVNLTIAEANPADHPVDGVQSFEVQDTSFYDVTPNTFVLNFTGATQRTQTLRYKWKPVATNQNGASVVSWESSGRVMKGSLSVRALAVGPAGWSVSADPSSVNVSPYEESEAIDFVITSDTFTGDLEITDSSSQDYFEEPNDVPKILSVAAGETKTFTKRLTKVHSGTTVVSFTVKQLPSGPSQRIDIYMED